MAAVAVGLHFGVPITKIKNAIEAYNPDNSRSQWVQKGSNQIIMDAYNANPTSMRAAIENFAASGLPNKMLWLGGMKEMGQDEVKEHTELVQLISRYLWADVILVGNEFKGLNNSYRWFATSQEASNEIQNHQPKAASILIKGSRGSKMELLLNVL
jgi:UDP-N-acetylmuramoyl-tripeptide--D-alanyl-D-alanine ligase